jgi:alkylated DNA nucleotide flippase Atl1
MTYKDWARKRMEFKGRVLDLLKDPRFLSYGQIGEMVGVSNTRVGQIRKEFGLPRRRGISLLKAEAENEGNQ